MDKKEERVKCEFEVLSLGNKESGVFIEERWKIGRKMFVSIILFVVL